MRTELSHNPSSGVVKVVFDRPGEQLVVRARSLVARDAAVEARTTVLARRTDGGHEEPTTTFTATAPGQSLWVAPPIDGAVASIPLDAGTELFLDGAAWLASTAGVTLDSTWHGSSKFFDRGAPLARAWGEGEVWVGAYGGLHVIEVGRVHDAYLCDSAHVVAFSQGLRFEVRDQEGLRSPAGLGRAATFSGQGRIWLQTRKPAGLAAFCHPFRGVGGGRQEDPPRSLPSRAPAR